MEVHVGSDKICSGVFFVIGEFLYSLLLPKRWKTLSSLTVKQNACDRQVYIVNMKQFLPSLLAVECEESYVACARLGENCFMQKCHL